MAAGEEGAGAGARAGATGKTEDSGAGAGIGGYAGGPEAGALIIG